MKRRAPLSFGVLAEDATDATTVRVLIQRLRGSSVPVRDRKGGGCANLRRKAKSWAQELAADGATHLVLVHDLDRNQHTNVLHDPDKLSALLEKLPFPDGVPRHICVPIEELEAWFWSCELALSAVVHDPRPELHPEGIAKPKERLMKASRAANNKPRYSTNDNRRLAELLDLDRCAERCPSFAAFRAFVEDASVST